MKRAKNNFIVSELIEEGNKYNFDNNKYYAYGEVFSRATAEFLSWVSKVDNYISSNYNETSGPYKMLLSVNKSKFSGHYQYEFESEMTKLLAAIKSCENLKPNKIQPSNRIIDLITNPLFWTILICVIGASYKLGFDNGNTKYENEKIELSENNKILRDSLNHLRIQSDKKAFKLK